MESQVKLTMTVWYCRNEECGKPIKVIPKAASVDMEMCQCKVPKIPSCGTKIYNG